MNPRLRLDSDAGGGGGDASREGSAQLRGPERGAMAPVDPAGQSLGDALRITFGLLKLAMVVLLVLYILSGFQRVNEGEKGVRLLFGNIQSSSVDPGFQFAWPFPFGQLEKINTGANPMEINTKFWPETSDPTASADKLTPSASLKPADNSGSLYTADGNIAHAQVKFVYRRVETLKVARSVLSPAEEGKLVEAAVMRGMVHAAAEVSIDDLLKQTNAVAAIARDQAQQALDAMECGIVIDSLTMLAIPPVSVRNEFASVQAAVSKASKAAEDARLAADRTLNEAAGSAAPAILEGITQYEKALAAKDQAAADAALSKVNEILGGAEVTFNDRKVQVAGEAARLVNEARQYRSEVSSRRKAELTAFNAKLEQYKANPALMVQREWQDAVSTFWGRDSVQTMLIPPGVRSTTLLLNADPDDVQKRDRARREQEGRETERQRLEELQRSRFQTQPTPSSGA